MINMPLMWLLNLVFRILYKVTGFKIIENRTEGIDKAVLILLGHTSNWDFIYGAATMSALGIPMRFTIKKEWNKFPFSILAKNSAIFIDRSPKDPNKPRPSAVDQMANCLKEMKRGYLVVTPEGTRSPRDKWKSGFYHVAVKAGVPIVFGYIDYKKKVTGIAEPFYPTGDYDKDLKSIATFYSEITPKFPEKFMIDKSVALN
jgi:1-acyl-sn-glycerol-3-phosphate acyltransferase